MHTTTATNAGSNTDLLSGILGVEIRNEDKISAADILFCENQQKLLYKTLRQIARWYGIFAEEDKSYGDPHMISFKKNGEVNYRTPAYSEETGYSLFEFKPFKSINELAATNQKANQAFADRIIRYFNRTYNVSVPTPEINSDTIHIGFRPQYMTYVDAVITHLGNRSFRQTAEEELVRRFHNLVKPGPWSKVKPELKSDKISFPCIVTFDDFYYNNYGRNHVDYNSHGKIDSLCEGIAFGADDVLNGSARIVTGLNEREVDTSEWYELTLTNATGIKFFRNGRVDVRFKNREAANRCFNRLRLDELKLHEK